jgi:hypothetical protein
MLSGTSSGSVGERDSDRPTEATPMVFDEDLAANTRAALGDVRGAASDIPAAAIRPMVRAAVALNQSKGDPTKRTG